MNYFYTNKRSEFGKPFILRDTKATIVVSFPPEPDLENEYVYKYCVDKGVQATGSMSVSEIDSGQVPTSDRGMCHVEGGWPKEINLHDEEQIERFRKRTQRDDTYIDVLKRLTVDMEHYLLQNNAVNIYQEYFPTLARQIALEQYKVLYRNTFHCPVSASVNTICWQPGEKSNFLITLDANQSFIWKIENSIEPLDTLEGISPITCAEFTPRDNYRFASGMKNGQTGFWDTRCSSKSVAVSLPQYSHRRAVTDLEWVASKSGNEFFTIAGDGLVKWWDREKLTKPTEEMSVGFPLTKIDYDIGAPSRYMVATANGYIVAGNRRGITPQEKLPWRIHACCEPILSIQKNPIFAKNFLISFGDIIMVWNDSCRESAIIATAPQKGFISRCEWSPTRPSLILSAKDNGFIDVWDLVRGRKEPIASLQVSKHPLTSVRFHENGEFVLIGDSVGCAHLIELSENLTHISPDEKLILSGVFDLEAENGKILESRARELLLKKNLEAQHERDETDEELSEEFLEDDREIAKEEDLSNVLFSLEETYLEEVQNFWAGREPIPQLRESLSIGSFSEEVIRPKQNEESRSPTEEIVAEDAA